MNCEYLGKLFIRAEPQWKVTPEQGLEELDFLQASNKHGLYEVNCITIGYERKDVLGPDLPTKTEVSSTLYELEPYAVPRLTRVLAPVVFARV